MITGRGMITVIFYMVVSRELSMNIAQYYMMIRFLGACVGGGGKPSVNVISD